MSSIIRLDVGDPARDRVDAVLNDPGRVNVNHSYSLHNMVEVEGGVRLHLVLKFKYDEDAIEKCFGAKKPEDDVVKLYSNAFRLFPYCLFNSVDETPLSWTYQNNNGRVYERIELLVTLTDVKYMRHYPFELRLLNLKVGSDGTAKTGLVNLLPEVKKGSFEPNVDFGVFKKKTSALQIGDDPVRNGNVICRMVMRDLTGEALGNMKGLYTRVYTVFFFVTPFWESLFQYIVLSTMLLHATMFLPLFSIDNAFGTMLAIVLTQVALLFSMPDTKGVFTTAETVVVAHAIYFLVIGYCLGMDKIVLANRQDPSSSANATAVTASAAGSLGLLVSDLTLTPTVVAVTNVFVTLCTVAYVVREYQKFTKLVQTIKAKFQSSHPLVGTYGDIDAQI